MSRRRAPVPGTAPAESPPSRRAPSAAPTVNNAARPARRGRAYRKSILSGEHQSIATFESRDALVRVPAEAALEGLLTIGTTDEDGREVLLDYEKQMRYMIFTESKKNYLSEADYLSPTALTDAYPGILDDPAGPVSTLVRLCNLTSFLYRVLSAAPAPDGSRPKLARASLESAALGFLSYVVPVDEPMHDGVLKQLVGIKCQIFLSALSNARGPLDPSTFFNQPLSAYFPALGVGALANRESAVRFRRYCESAVELIEQVGLDYDVLQTHWRWKDLVGELRSYCAGVARDRIGSESESGESLRAASEELDELFDENAEDETPTLDRLRSESVVAEQLDVLSPRRLQLQQLQEQQQRSRSLLRSLASERRTLDSNRAAEAAALEAGSDSQDTQDTPTQASRHTQISHRASDLLAMEEDDEDDSQGSLTQTATESAPIDARTTELLALDAASDVSDSEDDDEAEPPEPKLSPAEPKLRLQIDAANKLAYLPEKPVGRFMAPDRQRERIPWDSQSQPVSPIASSSRLPPVRSPLDHRTTRSPSRPLPRASDEKEAPEQARARQRSLSPERAETAAPEPTAAQQAANDADKDAFFENLNNDFGGGGEDEYRSRSPSRERSKSAPARKDKGKGRAPRSESVASPEVPRKLKPLPIRAGKVAPAVVEADGFESAEETDIDAALAVRKKATKRRSLGSDDDARPAKKGLKDKAREQRRKRKMEKAVREYQECLDGVAVTSSSDDDDDVPRPTRENKFRQDRNRSGGRVFWTEKEERALRKAMETHQNNYATIIRLHGPHGTRSTRLKARNEVSLKDKARNMKKRLVDSGLPIPFYLENVSVPKPFREALEAARRATPEAETDED